MLKSMRGVRRRRSGVTPIMQMLRKNPVNTRVVEKKTKIFKTDIRQFFRI